MDWAAAAAAFAENGAVPLAVWNALVEGWLTHVVEARGPTARWSRSQNFLLVETTADDRGRHALQWANDIRAFLLRHLDGIAEPHSSPLPLLLFTQQSDYIDWHVDYEADLAGEELASSGGMFVNGPCPHIAAPLGLHLEAVLAHELTHALVRHLPLPLWLNEGFAVAMESLWTRQPPQLSTEDIAEHRHLWSPTSIQRFWSGQAFRDTTLQKVAYQLAHVLATRLAGNYDRLCRFANDAMADDAGAAAFATTYGEDLRNLLQPMLGRGDWQPSPERW